MHGKFNPYKLIQSDFSIRSDEFPRRKVQMFTIRYQWKYYLGIIKQIIRIKLQFPTWSLISEKSINHI